MNTRHRPHALFFEHYSGSVEKFQSEGVRLCLGRLVVNLCSRQGKIMAAKKKTSKRTKPRKAHKTKTASRAKKKLGKKRTVRAKKTAKRRVRGSGPEAGLVAYETRGLGARSGGQSGDTQGLSAVAGMDSESVEELLEEGQSFEAGVLEGVENAPDADEAEVHTREVLEDDVPEEYRGKD